jgi:hypothetical protein
VLPVVYDVQETLPAAVQFCDTSHASDLKVTADGASVCWLAPDTALLCLRSGQLLQLALLQQPAGGGRRMALARAGAAPQPSCCCSLARNTSDGEQSALFFIGSTAGDTLLVRAATAASIAGAKRSADKAAAVAAGEAQGSEPAAKRLRLESIDGAALGGSGAAPGGASAPGTAAQQLVDAAAATFADPAAAGSDSEDEEALIYGTALMASAGTAAAPAPAPTAASQLQRYQLNVLDSLANIGPVRDFSIADTGGQSLSSLLVYLPCCSSCRACSCALTHLLATVCRCGRWHWEAAALPGGLQRGGQGWHADGAAAQRGAGCHNRSAPARQASKRCRGRHCLWIA